MIQQKRASRKPLPLPARSGIRAVESIRKKGPQQNRQEKKLALAIFSQALRDLVAISPPASKERDWQQDAADWLRAEKRSPGGFQWVCDVLAMDPDSLKAWCVEYQDADRETQIKVARRLSRFTAAR